MGDAGDPPLTVKWDLAASQVLDPEGGSEGAFTEAAFSVGTALTSPCPPATAPAGSRRDYKGGEPSVCRCDEKRTVEWSRLWNIEPVTFHPYLLELCEQAVCEVSGTPAFGNEGTSFTGITLDSQSNVSLGGMTGSADFPLQNPFTPTLQFSTIAEDSDPG